MNKMHHHAIETVLPKLMRNPFQENNLTFRRLHLKFLLIWSDCVLRHPPKFLPNWSRKSFTRGRHHPLRNPVHKRGQHAARPDHYFRRIGRVHGRSGHRPLAWKDTNCFTLTVSLNYRQGFSSITIYLLINITSFQFYQKYDQKLPGQAIVFRY